MYSLVTCHVSLAEKEMTKLLRRGGLQTSAADTDPVVSIYIVGGKAQCDCVRILEWILHICHADCLPPLLLFTCLQWLTRK